jgi:hypothetical protein
MGKYPDEEIERARELRRKERYSFAQLQRITGIPATTIRNWCSNDSLGTRWDILLTSNERKRQEIKASETSIISTLKNISNREAKIFAALIYWCEGTKYPASNKLEFTNSDPTLQKLFISLLRKSFPLDESKFRVHLQIHDIHVIQEINRFWSKLLSIPESQFIKPTITKARGGKHRKEYFGTCALRYTDFRIQLKLIGIYEAFAKRFEALQ